MIDIHLLAKLTHSPQSVSSLCAHFQCTRRELQYARKSLESDYPVLSDQRGMWLCDNPIEYHYVIAHEIKLLVAARERIEDSESCLQHTWPEFQPRLFQLDEVA